MRAWIIETAGGPDAFELRNLPTPEPKSGEVLIEIKAFGLNRSEYFTRIGDSPSVKFPRVLGIECVGVVASAPGGEFKEGQKVAAMMGGLGRQFDGSYAEFSCVPASIVFPLETDLAWEKLGALPEMLQTTHGSLHTGLNVQEGNVLLVRGGTSSIGLATMSLAKASGLRVVSTSRNEKKKQMLLDLGAEHVFIDSGTIADDVREVFPDGVDRVLELIGTKTLLDSLQCAKVGGVVCMTGILGGEWEFEKFRPMEQIPTGVCLTSYSGGASDITADDLQRYVDLVAEGSITIPLGPSWEFEQLRDAHQAMDENRANGKMVVVVNA